MIGFIYGILALASFNAYYNANYRPWHTSYIVYAEAAIAGLLFFYYIPYYLLKRLYE